MNIYRFNPKRLDSACAEGIFLRSPENGTYSTWVEVALTFYFQRPSQVHIYKFFIKKLLPT